MNALSIVNKVVSLVSFKMHKTRQKAVIACVKSLLNGSAATATSIGRGINTRAFEKHRIKRADRLLSNPNLLSEAPLPTILWQHITPRDMTQKERHP